MMKVKERANWKKMVFVVCFIQLVISQSKLENLLPKIDNIVQLAKQNIWSQIERDEFFWNMPPTLGTFFLSEYYFELKVFELDESPPFPTRFNEEQFTAKLLREQLSDGSWKQIDDMNKREGLLDATIFNYWYLKEVGLDIMSSAMLNARKFILDHGGLEKAQVMTKYKLAAFGQYQWQLLNYIPLFLFKNEFPFHLTYLKDKVAQWVYPHLTALAYLRYHKTIFPVSKVCLSELMATRSHPPCQNLSKQYLLRLFNKFNRSQPLVRDSYVDNLLDEAVRVNGEKGAFGGYTVSTLLNLMSFKDYTLRYNITDNMLATFFNKTITKSLEYVQNLYFNKRTPYEGNLCDGRYWDSILSIFALLESGESPEKLQPYVEYLVSKVQINGGIPYGSQFEYAPDIDDTSLLLAIYGKMKKYFNSTNKQTYYDKEIQRTLRWIKQNQNEDGGLAAFDKGKNGGEYSLLKFVFWLTKIDKSAEIFDPSCPDIAGHFLEGLGETGLPEEKGVILKVLEYLYKSRKDGWWSGRWGINYVYAAGAVYPGLTKIGFNMNQEWILNITKKLIQVQQSDGGFGEDSQSYNQERYIGGVTTVSMTAWGLLALIEASHTLDISEHVFRAASYLIHNFEQNGGKFVDRSVVAPGHRGILNLQYPAYPYTFPLIALSRLQQLVKGRKVIKVDGELMGMFSSLLKAENVEL